MRYLLLPLTIVLAIPARADGHGSSGAFVAAGIEAGGEAQLVLAESPHGEGSVLAGALCASAGWQDPTWTFGGFGLLAPNTFIVMGETMERRMAADLGAFALYHVGHRVSVGPFGSYALAWGNERQLAFVHGPAAGVMAEWELPIDDHTEIAFSGRLGAGWAWNYATIPPTLHGPTLVASLSVELALFPLF